MFYISKHDQLGALTWSLSHTKAAAALDADDAFASFALAVTVRHSFNSMNDEFNLERD